MFWRRALLFPAPRVVSLSRPPMRHLSPTRLSTLMLLALSAPLHTQSQVPHSASRYSQVAPASSLPPNAPTTAPAPSSTASATPPQSATPAESPAQRANISYTAGQLAVSASNSSLNQILREIARLTGIKITGGVAEERVFGDYGPGEPAEVLGKLLDGTGSNMLFIAGDPDSTAELILTPRVGDPTPPNPNALSLDGNDDDDLRRPVPSPAPPESQSRPALQNPEPTPINPQPPANTNTAQPTPVAPSADSNQGQSPNGVKTPQQIYDELMRLRRQQQSQPQ